MVVSCPCAAFSVGAALVLRFVGAPCPKQLKQRSFCSSPPASLTWRDRSLDFVMVQ